MFVPCRDYLKSKLVEAGLKTRPLTSRKELERSPESHIGAVLFDSDEFLRNGSKRIFKTNGATVKRRTVFDRSMVFSVVLGDYKEEQVAALLERFLLSLDRGIKVGEQYVPIEVEAADWVDAEDSILKSKLAIQLKVRFLGVVYQDSGFRKAKALEVVEIGKENHSHGN